jgi:hypothetical protein
MRKLREVSISKFTPQLISERAGTHDAKAPMPSIVLYDSLFVAVSPVPYTLWIFTATIWI